MLVKTLKIELLTTARFIIIGIANSKIAVDITESNTQLNEFW